MDSPELMRIESVERLAESLDRKMRELELILSHLPPAVESLKTSVATLEGQVRAIENDLSAREERDKNIDRILEEIKAMLKSYTDEMKLAFKELSDRIGKIEGRPSKIWDAFVFSFAAAVAGGVFAFVSGLFSKGTP